MAVIFVLLFLAAFGCLVVGMISPSVFSQYLKTEATRGKLFLLFGGAMFVFMLFGGACSNATRSSSSSSSASVEESVKDASPVTLTGFGQQATRKFSLNRGLSVFKLTHNGDANFAAVLMDSNGTYIDLLANVIGNFDGSKAVRIPRSGEYLINITANGNWQVTIE